MSFNLSIEDLNLNFVDISNPENDANFGFGPSKKQLRSLDGWEGFDGKVF